MERIFINMHEGADWILRFLAQDIQREAEALGYSCRIGKFEDYDGEDIYLDYLYNAAVPMKRAKHNSVFYTHLNYTLQEKHLCSLKDKFDSFICMSPEDAAFLIELGFDKNKVYGRTLPVRNTYIKPISIGIFSACYPDDRKNEAWLIEYCKSHKNAQLANFVFIGKDWGRVVAALNENGCSATWYSISRNLPYEYQFQQNQLALLDYYIYMGMDGGAMGTYDAYAQGVPLCVTYDGFHKTIPHIDYTFDEKNGFFEQLNVILQKQEDRYKFFKENSPSNYVDWLINVFVRGVNSTLSEADKTCLSYNSVLEKKRTQYYPVTINRLINYIRHKLYISKYDKRINRR